MLSKQIFFLLLFLSFTFATSIDVQIQNQSCPDNADFLKVLYNLPTCIVEKFFSSLISGFVYSAKQFLENSLNFIVKGPDITLFCSPYSKIMKILESLYTIALMGVGTYYIVNATEPEKRANSKLWIQNIFFMIIALSVSFSIFKMILEINQYITSSIYNNALANLSIQATFSSLIFAFILSLNFILAAGVTFLTLLIRYIMIPFLLLLFPFAIFLYFIPFTKSWGSFLFKFILMIIFMTSVDAILILGLSFLFSVNDPNISGGFIQGMALMIGFGLIGIINVIIYIIAVLSLIFGAVKMFEGVISIGWKIALLAKLL